ncbi:MAG: hypothetical protein WCP97_02150 [bacterium]
MNRKYCRELEFSRRDEALPNNRLEQLLTRGLHRELVKGQLHKATDRLNKSLQGFFPNISFDVRNSENAGYWIARAVLRGEKPFRMIMGRREIEQYNREVRLQRSSRTLQEELEYVDRNQGYNVKEVRETIQQIAGGYFFDDDGKLKENGDIGLYQIGVFILTIPVRVTDEVLDGVKTAFTNGTLPGQHSNVIEQLFVSGEAKIKPKKLGLLVKPTRLHIVPLTSATDTEQFVNQDNDIVDTRLDIGTVVIPLAERKVLGEDWIFVKAIEGAENYHGWVKKGDIALGERDVVEAFEKKRADNFYVISGSGVQYQGMELNMGVRLLRNEDGSVLLPSRGSDGNLHFLNVQAPKGDDVRTEYMPYTAANVVAQVMKTAGRPWEWSFNDCSSLLQDLYRVFGIEIPRNTSNQRTIPGKRVDFQEHDSEDDRLRALSKLRMGALGEMPNHIFLWLGDGVSYQSVKWFRPSSSKDELQTQRMTGLVNVTTTFNLGGVSHLKALRSGVVPASVV